MASEVDAPDAQRFQKASDKTSEGAAQIVDPGLPARTCFLFLYMLEIHFKQRLAEGVCDHKVSVTSSSAAAQELTDDSTPSIFCAEKTAAHLATSMTVIRPIDHSAHWAFVFATHRLSGQSGFPLFYLLKVCAAAAP